MNRFRRPSAANKPRANRPTITIAQMSLADAWEANADEWINWARAPHHDGFWEATWPELAAVLPDPVGLTIEVGCGEGRASRQLMAAGHSVVAVERSPSLVRAAHTGNPPVNVVRGDAAALPFPNGSAGLVVACMVLQDVDDLDGTSTEIAACCNLAGVSVSPSSTRSRPLRIPPHFTPGSRRPLPPPISLNAATRTGLSATVLP